MQILAKDGKEFKTVEECMSYEHELELAELRDSVYNNKDVAFYIVDYHINEDKPTSVVLVIHAKWGYQKEIAEFLLSEKLGSASALKKEAKVRGTIESNDVYCSWNITQLEDPAKNVIGRQAVESQTAWIFEADDVPKIFPYATDFSHKCKCGGACKSQESVENKTESKVESKSLSRGNENKNTTESSASADLDIIKVLRPLPMSGGFVLKKIRRCEMLPTDTEVLDMLKELKGNVDLSELIQELFERN